MKQVYDLTPADIQERAIWVFPMDDSVEDEASVRPVAPGEIVPDGLLKIVRTVFRDQLGRLFPGYVYVSSGDEVVETRPVAWAGGVCVTFWNGMIEPAPGYLGRIRSVGLRWPIEFETDASGVPPKRGTLDGIYYLEGDRVRCVIVG